MIHIRGDIPSIENFDKQLVLFDTPGPNNSQDKSHGELTKQILNDGKSGLIIYLLNATQIGVDDDAQLLSMVEEAFGQSNNHKDIVFVLNKADQFDEEDGESLKGIVSSVSNYVEKHGFNTPIVIPVSAHAALLARKRSNNLPLTRKENRAFENYLDHVDEGFPDIGRYAKSVDSISFDLEAASDEEKVIYYSGILILEKLLENKVKN
jgi:GTPase Era involved in 16S rRNA processing